MSLVVNLIGQRSRDVIGRLSVSRDVIGCEVCKSNWCVSIRINSNIDLFYQQVVNRVH